VLVRLRREVQEVPRALIRLLASAGLVAVALTAYATVRIWQAAGQDDRRAVDAIVVLGAAQYDGRPSPVFAARLDHAIALYHDGLAPRLIMTGGGAEGDRTTEAASGRAYAIAHGVPDGSILGEDRSRTTLESLRGVADIMTAAGLRSALFVSDPTHMYRVLLMAGDVGITEAWGSPTRTSPISADPVAVVDAVVHEVGALAVYTFTGGSP
jgi:uncharacterized SAM-binding protein YcdF (DUF218 family)